MKRTNFGKRFLRGLCRWAGLIGWAVAVGGCGSEPAAEVDPWLEVTPDVVSFGSDEVGIVRRVEVRSHAAAFSTRVVYYGQEQEWLEVVRDRAGVELAARTVNRGGEARHAAVTVEVAGTGPQTISVTQRGTDDGTDYGIQLEPSSLRLAASGQEATGVVRIVTAGDGVSAESGAGWCTVRLSGDLLQVTAGEHADRQARTCAVTVSNAQGETAELAVWQAGADDSPVVLEPDRLTFAASGTDLSRTVAVHTAGTGITAHTDAAWIALYLSGEWLSVTVEENGGAERQAEVTVSNAEGGRAVLAVQQEAGVFRLEPDRLQLGAGEPLSAVCTVSGGSEGLTARPDAACAAWLTASVEENRVTVTAAPNPAFVSRTGRVLLANAAGASGTLTVEQAGREWVELCGVWSWQSLLSTEGGEVSCAGTATLTRVSGEAYRLTGLAGEEVGALGVTDPVIRLACRDGRLGVVCGEAFGVGDTRYYFSGGVVFPSGEMVAWHDGAAFLELVPERVERDGAVYDRLVFAGTVTAAAEQFPDRPEVWGETGRVCYRYYRLVSFGGVQQAVPVETHRELVLERPAR